MNSHRSPFKRWTIYTIGRAMNCSPKQYWSQMPLRIHCMPIRQVSSVDAFAYLWMDYINNYGIFMCFMCRSTVRWTNGHQCGTHTIHTHGHRVQVDDHQRILPNEKITGWVTLASTNHANIYFIFKLFPEYKFYVNKNLIVMWYVCVTYFWIVFHQSIWWFWTYWILSIVNVCQRMSSTLSTLICMYVFM